MTFLCKNRGWFIKTDYIQETHSNSMYGLNDMGKQTTEITRKRRARFDYGWVRSQVFSVVQV